MSSRIEQFYEALLNGGEVPEPQSRIEKQLHALLYGGDAPAPQTRAEAYLAAIRQKGGSGGGGVKGEFVRCNSSNPSNVTPLSLLGNVCVAFLNAESIQAGAFDESHLKAVDLPVAKSIGDSAFFNNMSLVSVDVPKVVTIGANAFTFCHSLTRIDLPNATSIDSFAFSMCTSLSAIILRAETMCQMNLEAILGTKIATEEGVPTGEGFIYVPSALYEDYVANFVMQITVGFGLDEATAAYMATAVLRKIEDYPEICG